MELFYLYLINCLHNNYSVNCLDLYLTNFLQESLIIELFTSFFILFFMGIFIHRIVYRVLYLLIFLHKPLFFELNTL